MNEETIIKLLKSSNKDDKLLGVTLAVEVLGRPWCKNHFIRDRYKSCEHILIKYDDFDVFIVPSFIELYAEDCKFEEGVCPVEKRGFENESLTIINNKTNVTKKELYEDKCKA